jgi:hypothetical protein
MYNIMSPNFFYFIFDDFFKYSYYDIAIILKIVTIYYLVVLCSKSMLTIIIYTGEWR